MGDCQSLGDCDDKRIVRLYEYLDGALSLQDLTEVKAHLEHCGLCPESTSTTEVPSTTTTGKPGSWFSG